MLQENFHDERAYALSLGLLSGIGKYTQRQLLFAFPQFHDLYHASLENLNQVIAKAATVHELYQQLHDQTTWISLWKLALSMIEQHKKANISVIALTSPEYPALLKKIPDPPVVLYAKGNLSLLQQSTMIAIVGTRNPTADGERITFYLAKYFASRNYCIVSGLAKGIDTIAHKGALHVQGRTIAVLATPLDRIYPAENKALAQQIVEQDGLLISELALGEKSFRSAFVQRDRLQSGLSLGIIPIQTALDGGTMHTIKFAQQQRRLVACPYPSKADKNARQYEGINAVMNNKSPYVYAFQTSQVEKSDISMRLQKVQETLLPDNLANHEQTYSMISNQHQNNKEETSLLSQHQEDHVAAEQPTLSTSEEILSQSDLAPDQQVPAETLLEQQPSNEIQLQQEQETLENVAQTPQKKTLLTEETGKETKKTTTRSRGKKGSPPSKETKQTRSKKTSSTNLLPTPNETEPQPIDSSMDQAEEHASRREADFAQPSLWSI